MDESAPAKVNAHVKNALATTKKHQVPLSHIISADTDPVAGNRGGIVRQIHAVGFAKNTADETRAVHSSASLPSIAIGNPKVGLGNRPETGGALRGWCGFPGMDPFGFRSIGTHGAMEMRSFGGSGAGNEGKKAKNENAHEKSPRDSNPVNPSIDVQRQLRLAGARLQRKPCR